MPNHTLSKRIFKLIFLTISFTLIGCSSFKGTELDYKKIRTSTLNETIEYGVYTPPNWSKQERLPLVVFLHGARDDHNSIEQHKIHSYFDRQINAGKMSRFILVTPNGDNGFWENWDDGTRNYRDWVMQDILPKVQQDYNTLECPKHCSLMGISMGGFGALRMVSYYKNSFSSISAISAPILSNDSKESKIPLLVRLYFPLNSIFGPRPYNGDKSKSIHRVWTNKEDRELQKIRLQLIVGSKDQPGIIKANQRFHQFLKKSNRPHEFHQYQGGHKWEDWKPNFERVIKFLLK